MIAMCHHAVKHRRRYSLYYYLTNVEIVTFPILFRHELPLNESVILGVAESRLVAVHLFL